MREIKRWLLNLALLFASVTLAVAIIEIPNRWFLKPYRFILPRYYERADSETCVDMVENFPKQYVYFRPERCQYRVWTNELGCFDLPFNKNSDYALLVGDSFTYSYNPFRYKWPSIAEGLLDYRILKCGVIGYGTKQELTKSSRVIGKIGFPPKLIIVGYFINDVIDDYTFKWIGTIVSGYRAGLGKELDPDTGEFIYTKKSWTNEKEFEEQLEKETNPFYYDDSYPILKKIRYWLRRNSVTYNLIINYFKPHILLIPKMKDLLVKFGISDGEEKNNHNAQQRKEQKVRGHDPELLPFYTVKSLPWLQKAWQGHLENIRALKEKAIENNANLLFVLIPDRIQVYPFLIPQNINMKDMDLEQPNRILGEFLAKENIAYLDLLPFFRKYANQTPRKHLDSKKDLYYMGDAHWSRKGDYLAGLLVARYIIENGLLSVESKEDKLNIIQKRLNKF